MKISIHPINLIFNFLPDIFLKIRSLGGGAVGIVMTFIISAALHLFEVRVTIVLLGLAIMTLIENRLDKFLPKNFSKLWFRITAFIHLVFLGCIMMGPENDDQSFINFAMEKWMELGFISFKILIVESVLCVILEVWRYFKN